MREEPLIESDEEIAADPVCGATVDLDQAREHALTSEYEGRDYVFCGPACRLIFESRPTRYAVPGRARP
jgi:YHS domain-containing protein